MPKVKKLTARKDYPDQGIVKGDTYYLWQFYRGKPRRSLTYPTRSQLTQNDTLQAVYREYDLNPLPASSEDIRAMASSIEEAGSEAQEKYDNLPEQFQQTEQGERHEQHVTACEEMVEELNDIADRVEAAEKEIEEYLAKRFGPEADPDATPDNDFVSEDWTLDVEAIREEVSGTEKDLD